MRPLVAHCYVGLTKLCHRTGEHTPAKEQRATAMAMYRDMGMTFWLDQGSSHSDRGELST